MEKKLSTSITLSDEAQAIAYCISIINRSSWTIHRQQQVVKVLAAYVGLVVQ